MSTPAAIIAAAIGRSTKNRSDILADNATELLRVVKASLSGAYSIAAEVNPQFFGVAESIAFAAGGWARPVEAENIFRIQNPALAEVVVVPYDDQAAETAKPAVYHFGQKFITAGNAGDPIAGNLTFFYSKRAPAIATIDTAIEAAWPSQYDELLVGDIATYLSLKDGRTDEARTLAEERNRWLVLFVKFLEHETTNTRHRFGHRRTFNTQSIVAEFAPYLLSGSAS